MILMNKTEWIPVFKTGTHTDAAGNTKDWTDADLDKIASSYQPDKHEAPVVIGHPKDNAPAYGWVESLKRDGNMLYAKFKDLAPEFVDMVRNKLFKKRSISLYPDLSLRHVGFLGAVPPAVKGLPDVAFKAKEKHVDIEFGDCRNCAGCKSEIDAHVRAPVETHGRASVLSGGKFLEEKSMKWFEWLKGKAKAEGVAIEDMPGSFSEPAVETHSRAPVQADHDAEIKRMMKARELEFAEMKKEIDAEKARVEAEGEKLAQAKADMIKAEIRSFCDGLCKDGKLTPAMMKCGIGMENYLDKMASITAPIEFSDGNTKKIQTPFEFMKEFLLGLGRQIEFGEVAGNKKDVGGGGAGEKLSALTKKKMGEDKSLTYSAAFAEVQKDNRELANQYAMEIMGG